MATYGIWAERDFDGLWYVFAEHKQGPGDVWPAGTVFVRRATASHATAQRIEKACGGRYVSREMAQAAIQRFVKRKK